MLRFPAGSACASAAILATLGGCASTPELSFAGEDASVTLHADATTATDGSVAMDADATLGDPDASSKGDATSPPDARGSDADADADAEDTGVDAGCRSTGGAVTCCGPLPCVGACAGNCSYCPTTCSPGQLCCIQVNGGGKVKRNDCVQSAADCT